MKIVICGSMAASKEMVTAEQELQKLKHEVELPQFTHEYAKMESLDKELTESARSKVEHDLIRRYFKKIEEGDALLVVNTRRKGIEGYIGGNAFLEIGFAFVLQKPIYLLYAIPDMGYRDEIEAMNPIILRGDFSKIK